MNEVLANIMGPGDEEVAPVKRLKNLTVRIVLTGILYLHSVVSIFRYFLIDNSRPSRLIMIYIKIVFMMASQSVFTGVLYMHITNIYIDIQSNADSRDWNTLRSGLRSGTQAPQHLPRRSTGPQDDWVPLYVHHGHFLHAHRARHECFDG